MAWLFPSLIATLTSTVALGLTYAYLYARDREPSMGIWTAGWVAYGLRFVCMLFIVQFGERDLLLIGNQFFSLLSGLLLLWGTYVWIGRQMPQLWFWASIVCSIWIVVATARRFPFLLLALPTFTLIGVIYIWIGVVMLRKKLAGGLGEMVTAWTFVLWGLHKIDYPFLRPVVWFAPWGYLLGAMFSLISAIGIILIYFDRARLELHQREADLRKAQAIARLGSYSWRIETDEVICSDDFHTILGCTSPPSSSDSLRSLIQPDDRERVEEAERRALEEGSVFEAEYRILCPNGRVRHVHDIAEITRNKGGKPILMFGTVQDITERKQAAKEHERLTLQVHEQARQMEQILATVPAGVLLLDAEWRVLQANPVAESDLAVLADAQVGDIVTHLSDRPLADLLKSPPTKGLWHEVQTTGRTFEVIARPVENGHRPEYWVLVINEVTREREVQRHVQQQERLAAVGQLAAGIAHDFNNFLAVIVLYTQMVLKAPDISSSNRERLETVIQQSKQAATLVQQILDFSRQAVLERQPMDLTVVLKDVVKLLRHTVPENIEVGLTHGMDGYIVSVDPTRIQQVILNLVVNARDAMPRGGRIHIALSRTEGTDDVRCVSCGPVLEGEWVSITVRDTGDGISPDGLPHIFEPFFTTKEADQGVGLGLAQVYGIVKQHDGHVDVITKAGTGTTFTIYLPALPSPYAEEASTETETVVRGKEEIILVVEDNATLRRALVENIALLDYQVVEAANGREALEILEQRGEEVSLVLSDLVMPEMGGKALFQAMKQRDINLPVVMLTGHPMEKELEDLKSQGMVGWMLKPPDMTRLSRLISLAVGRASETRRDGAEGHLPENKKS